MPCALGQWYSSQYQLTALVANMNASLRQCVSLENQVHPARLRAVACHPDITLYRIFFPILEGIALQG